MRFSFKPYPSLLFSVSASNAICLFEPDPFETVILARVLSTRRVEEETSALEHTVQPMLLSDCVDESDYSSPHPPLSVKSLSRNAPGHR